MSNVPAGLVQIRDAAGVVLGTGLALAPRWVLSAGHVLRQKQSMVEVVDCAGLGRAWVRTLHWDGAEQRILAPGWKTPGPCILLELADELMAGTPALGLVETLKPAVALRVFGLGQDAKGNYPTHPKAIDMKVLGVGPDGVDYAPAGDGAPGADDSGAPVLGPQGVVFGVHEGRRANGNYWFRGFDAQSRAWIDALRTQPAPGNEPFLLRARFPCRMVPKPDMLHGDFLLGSAGGRGLLQIGDVLRFEATGSGLALSVIRSKAVVIEGVKLKPVGVAPRVWAWSGEFLQGGAANTVYVFARELAATQQKAIRLRLEVFVEGGAHKRPTEDNLLPRSGRDWSLPPARSWPPTGPGVPVEAASGLQQEDEGEGVEHEP
ncbi:MAG: hypothetical protein MEQ07_06870 [Aquimonas sp.]|nr:hypothetical protein [Aquimonas sp.]